jgi:D-alanine--poly(phosphoribitol) ligase subunit 2
MDEGAFRTRALNLLKRACGGVSVGDQPHLRIYDAGLIDSLATVSLMAWIEKDLGITISPLDLDPTTWATPELFVADLERRAGIAA